MCNRSHRPLTSRRVIIDRFEGIDKNLRSCDETMAEIAAVYEPGEPDRFAAVMTWRALLDEVRGLIFEGKNAL